MNYNLPSEIVKNLSFGKEGKEKILSGIRKLSDAVESTLGASGQCVIYEDVQGDAVISKDGVTVAKSVILQDPIENIGASLIKQAAENTVMDAGDGTSSSTLLARYLIEAIYEEIDKGATPREIKDGIESGLNRVYKYLSDSAIDVSDETLKSVAAISCNNDKELGDIIGEAFAKVGRDGVVLIEDSETETTYSDVVDGVKFDSGLKYRHLATNRDRGVSELDNPYILISTSKIPNVRRISTVVEYAVTNNRPLLIIGSLDEQAEKALVVNKAKGNIRVNFVDPAGFGKTKPDTAEDLAILTGAKVFSEEMGDDMDMITPDYLGEAIKSVTDDKSTVLTIDKSDDEKIKERIEVVRGLVAEETKNLFIKKKQEERLAMLSGKVGVIYVGANSDVELKEKRDRVDDAVHATKASLVEGIVAGGGVALRDASNVLDRSNCGERALHKAINKPYEIILKNASLEDKLKGSKLSGWKSFLNFLFFDRYDNGYFEGIGINAVTGEEVDMIKANIVDPVLVTKTALKNAVSVSKTIISADCIISNVRLEV